MIFVQIVDDALLSPMDTQQVEDLLSFLEAAVPLDDVKVVTNKWSKGKGDTLNKGAGPWPIKKNPSARLNQAKATLTPPGVQAALQLGAAWLAHGYHRYGHSYKSGELHDGECYVNVGTVRATAKQSAIQLFLPIAEFILFANYRLACLLLKIWYPTHSCQHMASAPMRLIRLL